MTLGNLRLPVPFVLAEDLGGDRELLGAVEESGADNDLVAKNGLVVVHVAGAIGAVVTVDRFACVDRNRGEEVLGQ